MVINWYEHIDKCIKKNKLIYGFHAPIEEKEYQNGLLVKRMTELGWTPENIFKWFHKKNPEAIIDLLEIYDLITDYSKRPWPHKHNYRVFITGNEIKYINELDLSIDCKKFLLALVIFCKMMKIKKTKPVFKHREKSYVYYLATGKDIYNNGKYKAINKMLNDLYKDRKLSSDLQVSYCHIQTGQFGGKNKAIYNMIIDAPWIEWEAKRGYIFRSSTLETRVHKFCDKWITISKSICPVCGQEFVPSAQSKTNLCFSCYKAKRKLDNKSYDRRISHHQLKKDNILGLGDV